MQPWQSSERGWETIQIVHVTSLRPLYELLRFWQVARTSLLAVPKTSLVCTFPCLLKRRLPVRSGLPLSYLGLSLSSVYTGRFPISLERLPRFQANAFSLKNFLQYFLQGKAYWQYTPFLLVWGSIRSSLLKGNFSSRNTDFWVGVLFCFLSTLPLFSSLLVCMVSEMFEGILNFAPVQVRYFPPSGFFEGVYFFISLTFWVMIGLQTNPKGTKAAERRGLFQVTLFTPSRKATHASLWGEAAAFPPRVLIMQFRETKAHSDWPESRSVSITHPDWSL